MKIQHIKRSELTATKWTGGTTTQLFIYPEKATYSGRNFLCRISTATVEVAESNFTPLPGFERILMILDGQLTITHKDKYTKKLKPFDTDTFSGAWETKGKGLVTDFNVMLKGNIKATLEAILLNAGDARQTSISEVNEFLVIYLYKGNITLTLDTQTIEMQKEEVLIIETGNNNFGLDIIGKEESELVICSIK